MEANATSLRTIPDSIYFRELAPGESDSADIWVTNIGKSPTRIRFELEPNSPFTLVQPDNLILVPGLEVKATLYYTAKEGKSIESHLKVSNLNCTLTIPILATPPSPRIVTESHNISLGSIGVGAISKFSFVLSNIGVRDGNFEISPVEDIELIPSKGMIPPQKTIEVSAALKPTKLGDLKYELNIIAPECCEPIPPIEIHAIGVQLSVSLNVDGKEASELDFQTIYVGQRRIIEAQIVNHGNVKRSFVVHPPSRDGASQSPRSTISGMPIIESVFRAMPCEGFLNPYGSTPISLIFEPEPDPTNPGDLDNIVTNFSAIEIVETGQRIDFQMTGRSVMHRVLLSSVDFDFGKLDRMQKKTLILKITNDSHFLPTTFKIHPLAHFRFEPECGTIQPNQSKEVTILYYPKNYGVFSTRTCISFSDGLDKKYINLNAECGRLNEPPFKRLPPWEEDPNVKYNVTHPNTRFTYGLDEIKTRQGKRKVFDSYITDSAEKRRARTAMSEKRRTARMKAESTLRATVQNYTEEDVKELMKQNLMQQSDEIEPPPMEGLTPPDPPLYKGPIPFHIPDSDSVSESTMASSPTFISRHKVTLDDNVMIKKKFKGKPSTPQEINDCNRALTPAQQLAVTSSHQTINFGQLSVYSVGAKSFVITNNLQQNIVVSLNYEYDELSQSTPTTQVIPPKSNAGFDIKFVSKKPVNFMKSIQYTVNGHHSYSITVCAQVSPIDVQLSRQQMEFRFSPDSVTPVIKEFVTLTNKSDAPAEFSWSGMTAAFALSPATGTIPPLKMTNVEITYVPSTHPHEEISLVMQVMGGPTRALKCIGDAGLPKCSLSKKAVAFGLIPIGITKTQQIKIKNSGDDDAIFTLSYKGMSELQITPNNGRIGAHDSQILTLTCKSVYAHNFDFPVNIAIAGAQPLSFNVSGTSELPQVAIANQEIDFGRLFVGSSASQSATINNTGAIPAILFLDLSSHPEFRVEYTPQNGNTIELVSDAVFVTKNEANQMGNSTLSANPSVVSIAESISGIPPEDSLNGLVYKIMINEKTSLTFNLVFQPTEVGEHSFELPITMMNVISSSSFHLQPIVSAEAIAAPITVNQPAFDFGIAPIFNPVNPHARPVVQTVKLTNEDRKATEWHFILDNLDTRVFTIEPIKGRIENSQSQSVTVSFTPRETTPYSVQIPIAVQSDKDVNIIGSVQLTGVGTSRLFRTDIQNVCLPIVPLNVKSMATVNILNEAFIQSTFRIQMPVSETAFPIKVNFPEGNKMEHTTAKLPIQVSLTSSKPTSFSTMIGIVDDNGNATSFTVTATTDNSIFTLYPLLPKLNIKSLSKKPITAELKKGAFKATELTSRFLSAQDVMELKDQPWEPSCDPLMISFVQRYLSALVISTQISDFPNDFIRNEGALLNDILLNLTGLKKLPAESNHDPPKENEDPVFKRMESFKKLLYSLKSLGCLVASIHPAFLMSKQDFLQVMRTQVTKQLYGIDYFNAPTLESFDQHLLAEFSSSKSFANALISRLKVLESLYNALSIESWMMILTQVFKLFVLGRITPERFSNTPGIADMIKSLQTDASRYSNAADIMCEINRPTKTIQSSNIYSTAEGLLLKWATLYHCHQKEDLQLVLTDFNQLNDSIALASLIKEQAGIPCNNLIDMPSDRAARERNAIEVLNLYKLLKLGFLPTAQEIVDGNSVIICMTIAYFFETLPSFLPATTLEFQSSLHKTITKNVSISNPSKMEITYKASLEGSKNFSIPSDSITVGPGETGDFQVVFKARTVHPVTAKLTLMPSRPKAVAMISSETTSCPGSSRQSHQKMPAFSSPIVVNMVSNVSFSQPDGSFEIQGEIYQTTKVEIPVKNLIGVNAKLHVFTNTTRIADEFGKTIPMKDNLAQQVQTFISNPAEEVTSFDKATFTHFSTVLTNHKMFLLGASEVHLMDSPVTLELEFNPISLGTFRCLILLTNPEAGEIIYEVLGTTVMPQAVETAHGKFKVEAGKKLSVALPMEPMNQNLTRALAYSIEKSSALLTPVSERRFKDLLKRRVFEMESLFKQTFSEQSFTVANSSQQFYDTSSEYSMYKLAILETMGKGHTNSINITFRPTKAGEYPCHLLFTSKYDVRHYLINGCAIPATRDIDLEFATVLGRPVTQEIPVTNPSNDTWIFKINSIGDQCFSAPNRLVVKPHSTQNIVLTFNPHKLDESRGEMQVINTSKESVSNYKLHGTVDEPPAEDKIQIKCQARHPYKHSFTVNGIGKVNGVCNVTTTCPIIAFQPTLSFTDGVNPEFTFTVNAYRSGLSAGTITFTDPQTKNFCWYVVEIEVDSPSPEQTIEVKTIARKSVTVSIPVRNPKPIPATFSVTLSDDDMFGEERFTIPPSSVQPYNVIISPLVAIKRFSSVYFYSDDDGEFWYSIHIECNEPASNALAPLSAAVGKWDSTFITLENPLSKIVTFRVENDNPASFHVMSKRVLNLQPGESRRTEIRFIPYNVGEREQATVSFKSNETGDWTYKLAGIGKPPQPQSPVIVTTQVDTTQSAMVLFNNPYNVPTKFSVSMTEGKGAFKFLIKRNVFQLTNYGDEYQIPFTFSPKTAGQYEATVVISCDEKKIRWSYPIVGNSVEATMTEMKRLRCRAHQIIEEDIGFTLIGESEIFKASEYIISYTVPNGYDFVNNCLEVRAVNVSKKSGNSELMIRAKFAPNRPLNIPINVTIKNPMGQEWEFDLNLLVSPGNAIATITVESLLNKVGNAQVFIPGSFRNQTPFHAYMTSWSAKEFSVKPEHGFLNGNEGGEEETCVPVELTFSPTMYGKVQKGVLVIDTVDSQFIFDVIGKTPEYVPPVKGTLRGKVDEDLGLLKPKTGKIAKPRVSRPSTASPKKSLTRTTI